MATEPSGSNYTTTSSSVSSSSLSSLYLSSSASPEDIERREMTEAFYNTYDVMTGVRIAATLGGFFGLMVILVLYKSKSKTEKALEDPDFTAAAVAEVEEEDERQLAAVIEASAYQQLNPKRARRSLDTCSVPPGWIKSTRRFSSIGRYSSLMEPPTRAHSRLASLVDDEDTPPLYENSVFYNDGHLEVPRRPSNITCSSSGSSYLERRDSAVALGLPIGHKSRRRRQSSPLVQVYDFYYPIDIKVIQATPGGSPFASNRALYAAESPLMPRLAPLASISSCNSSSLDPDFDVEFAISDSVFQESQDSDDDDDDEEAEAATDNEVEQFETDSDDEENGACINRKKKIISSPSLNSTSTLVDENYCSNLGEVVCIKEALGAQETLF